MITAIKAYDELRNRLGEFRKGTNLSTAYTSDTMWGSINSELILEWEDVELKSEAVVGGSALFLVRCDGLQTAGIFANLGAAVAEFQRQCALWEAEHGT